jgi:uncharacterized YigZ family protein
MTEPDSYLTIETLSKGFYKEKGSKFLSFAFPIIGIEQVKDHLDELKKDYHDARHYCYAYVIGSDQKQYRANDDGEPGHSAGDPILGQIRSKDLTNILIVVVRYFGGTKLGVSGLINAYRTSAEDALSQARIVSIEITREVKLSFKYEDTNEVLRLVGNHKVLSQEYTDQCMILIAVKRSEFDAFIANAESMRQQISNFVFEIGEANND